MSKRTKGLAVALCLLLFSTMALGSGESETTDTKEIVSAQSSEAASAAGEDESKSKDDSEKAKTESKEESAAEETSVTIKEQKLIDQSGIVITAQEYVTDSFYGDGIKVLLENNSDKDVTVGCDALIVNDYMISDLFVSDVASGKKANDTIYLSSTALKAAGIDTVGKIEIYFHVYDSSSYDKVFDSDCVTIKTSEFENMDTTANDDGTELYNEGGIRIVGKTVDENSFWGTAILLYCENTSDKKVGISVEDMSINGFMIDPIFSATLYEGKKAVDDITVLSSDLEENGIESIEDVELQFHIYDVESYETIKDTDPIKFSAK